MSAWTDHVAKWGNCRLCPLCDQRSNIVLARGQVPCDVVFVGEAPGASEDALGQPFVGPAGNLLDNDSAERPGIIQRGLPSHLEWCDVRGANKWVLDLRCAFTNIVACYPREAKERGDNEPEIAEIKACRPRLHEFITLAAPRLVVCVGSLASDWIGHDAYGKVMGADVVSIMHPAHILARLPMVQKHYAVQKCVVTIRSAVERMLQ